MAIKDDILADIEDTLWEANDSAEVFAYGHALEGAIPVEHLDESGAIIGRYKFTINVEKVGE
ncbi:hypothetical protein [Mycetocola saprophilus]|uniref:hypothetical protein n=1 Tax=Mycetocola saprophilus TaxID=76636 RepID=UPI0004C10758|nr:hypothetical protein [Mycetocola saprophilus]